MKKVDLSKRYCKREDRQSGPLQNLRFSKIFEKYKDTVHQKYNYCKSKDRQSRPLQNLRFSRHRRPFAKQGGGGPGSTLAIKSLLLWRVLSVMPWRRGPCPALRRNACTVQLAVPCSWRAAWLACIIKDRAPLETPGPSWLTH